MYILKLFWVHHIRNICYKPLSQTLTTNTKFRNAFPVFHILNVSIKCVLLFDSISILLKTRLAFLHKGLLSYRLFENGHDANLKGCILL